MISAFVTSSLCRNEVKPILASVVGSVMLGVLESRVVVTNNAEVVEVIAIGTESEVEDGPAADVLAEKFRLYWVDANCFLLLANTLVFCTLHVTDNGTNAHVTNVKTLQAKLTMCFTMTTVYRFQPLTEFIFLHPLNLKVVGPSRWRHFCHRTD